MTTDLDADERAALAFLLLAATVSAPPAGRESAARVVEYLAAKLGVTAELEAAARDYTSWAVERN